MGEFTFSNYNTIQGFLDGTGMADRVVVIRVLCSEGFGEESIGYNIMRLGVNVL